MRKLLLIALLAVSATASAAVRISPPEPIHVGDFVTIEIDVPFKLGGFEPPAFEKVNLVLWNSGWKMENWPSTNTFVVIGLPSSTSDIVVGPFTWRLADGRDVTTPAVRIPVLPEIADGSKPAESIVALANAGRPAIVMTTSMKRPVVYEGEDAVVQWWAVADSSARWTENLRFTPPAVEGMRSAWLTYPAQSSFDAMGAVMVRKQLRAEYHILAKSAGVYTVPPVAFDGADESRSFTLEREKRAYPFRRMAPAIQFEVLPRRGSARAAVGKFTLQCTAGSPAGKTGGPWPSVVVTAIGAGSLDPAAAPRFVARPNVTVVVRPGKAVTSFGGETRRDWTYDVHADEAKLPALAFMSYDSDRNENVEVRCTPPAVTALVAGSNRRPVTAKRSRRNDPMDRSSRSILEILGILSVVGSGYVLQRAIRG